MAFPPPAPPSSQSSTVYFKAFPDFPPTAYRIIQPTAHTHIDHCSIARDRALQGATYAPSRYSPQLHAGMHTAAPVPPQLSIPTAHARPDPNPVREPTTVSRQAPPHGRVLAIAATLSARRLNYHSGPVASVYEAMRGCLQSACNSSRTEGGGSNLRHVF